MTGETKQDKESGSIAWPLVGVALLLAVWGGGTWLAHWLWGFNWIVSALMAPVAIAALYVVLKLYWWIAD